MSGEPCPCGWPQTTWRGHCQACALLIGASRADKNARTAEQWARDGIAPERNRRAAATIRAGAAKARDAGRRLRAARAELAEAPI